MEGWELLHALLVSEGSGAGRGPPEGWRAAGTPIHTPGFLMAVFGRVLCWGRNGLKGLLFPTQLSSEPGRREEMPSEDSLAEPVPTSHFTGQQGQGPRMGLNPHLLRPLLLPVTAAVTRP